MPPDFSVDSADLVQQRIDDERARGPADQRVVLGNLENLGRLSALSVATCSPRSRLLFTQSPAWS